MVKAILYSSLTGFTREYAQMLGLRLQLPVHSLEELPENLENGDDILYLGWIRAGTLVGLKKVRQRFSVKAVCAVGMTAPGDVKPEEMARQYQLGATPLFYLQGGLRPQQVKGVNGLILKMAGKAIVSASKKQSDTAAQEAAALFQAGGSFVSENQLEPVIQYFEKEQAR